MPLGQTGGSASTSLIFLALMFVAFYLLLIRPQQKRMRNQRAMQQSLQVGDEIRTMGGFQVTIRRFDDDLITVELAPGVEARIVKQAVSSKVTSSVRSDDPADDDTDDDTEDDTDDGIGTDDGTDTSANGDTGTGTDGKSVNATGRKERGQK